jgi:hypothetical protein
MSVVMKSAERGFVMRITAFAELCLKMTCAVLLSTGNT